MCSSTVFREHDYIKVDKEDLENSLMENLLHEPLECRGRIAQPTGHPEEFKQPKGICECSLMDVTFIHRNLVEGRLQVNHREISNSLQSMHVLLDSGPGISIVSCPGIHQTVVHTHSKLSRLFPDKDNGASIVTVTWSDDALLQLVFQVLTDFLAPVGWYWTVTLFCAHIIIRYLCFTASVKPGSASLLPHISVESLNTSTARALSLALPGKSVESRTSGNWKLSSLTGAGAADAVVAWTTISLLFTSSLTWGGTNSTLWTARMHIFARSVTSRSMALTILTQKEPDVVSISVLHTQRLPAKGWARGSTKASRPTLDPVTRTSITEPAGTTRCWPPATLTILMVGDPAVDQQLIENLWLSGFLEKAACAREPEHPESRIPHVAFPAHLQPSAAAMIQVTLVLPLGASDSFWKTLCYWWKPWNLFPQNTSQALEQSQQTQRGSCPP